MTVPIPKLTLEEYLTDERKAAFKSEYYRGEMFAMAGGTGKHSEVGVLIATSLRSRLSKRGCKIYNSDMRVLTDATGLCTYPDVTVVCGKPAFADDSKDVLVNPKVIFEVLSDSTEGHDRGFKFQQYKRIETLEEYVLVSQAEPLVESFGRSPGGAWTEYSESRGMDGVLSLKSLCLEIPLNEIYEDVEFEP